MVSWVKSLQGLFTSILSDIPEGLRVVLDFLWKARWFIVGGYAALLLYTLAMKVLPFLMWTWVIKSIVGSVFSFL
jgi:hypothetical protein